MPDTASAAGRFTFPDTDLSVCRMGYGTMRLTGPHIWGPPADRDAALAVLREALALGVDHLDTADFYGPHVTNELILEALAPYPDDLVIVTKVGFRRTDDADWVPANSEADLRGQVDDNRRRLGLDVLPIANLRMGASASGISAGPLARPLELLATLQQEGAIAHIGLSTVSQDEVDEAAQIVPIVCVQNEYNLAKRDDDAMIDALAARGIAYVPYFPLGGFSPLQSDTLAAVAADAEASPLQVALAWLLQRSSNILVIPGTSSVDHLRENVDAASLALPEEAIARLDAMAGGGG